MPSRPIVLRRVGVEERTQGAGPAGDGAGLQARRAELLAGINSRTASIASVESEVGRAVLPGLRADGGASLPGARDLLSAYDAAASAIASLEQQLAGLDAEAEASATARATAADTATHCPACRTPKVEGSRFCVACGEPFVSIAAAENLGVCHHCGLPAGEGVAFCTGCGWRVGLSPLPWWRARWVRVFLAGLVLYGFAQSVLPSTDYNVGFVAAELAIGSLLVPVTFVTYFYERGSRRQMPRGVLTTTFLLGAVLGCAAAATLEGALRPSGFAGFLAVGLIEEGSKGAVVLWWLRRDDLRRPDYGFVIGAATGMGFAVLETMGTYALSALLSGIAQGASLQSSIQAMISVLNVRAVLSPLGHGTWTAILAGVIWHERAAGRPLRSKRVLIAYIGVSALHALYDTTIGWSVLLVPVPGSEVSFFGLLFGLVGFATIMFMVWSARQGGNPVETLAARGAQATKAVQKRVGKLRASN